MTGQVSPWVTDAGVTAGAVTVIIGTAFALAKMLRSLAHLAVIPERLDSIDAKVTAQGVHLGAVDSKVTAFGTRLDAHLVDEEAAMNGVTAQLAQLSERRSAVHK